MLKKLNFIAKLNRVRKCTDIQLLGAYGFFRAVFIQIFHYFGSETDLVEVPDAKEQPVGVDVVVTD